mmetsp:Transcript_29711/g.39528  ORF Transcript_29711/g.39528 Transcript_29711/m.39528 type:complete len:401 (+) Transcript_29711:110-1312(+)
MVFFFHTAHKTKINASHIFLGYCLMSLASPLLPGQQLEIGMPGPKLHSLLNLDPDLEEDRRRFDDEAFIEEIKQKPHAAKARYTFNSHDESYLPLHMVIMLGASTDVVELLLNIYPISIAATDCNGNTPLHTACEFQASLEVTSLLLEKFPGAAMEKDFQNNTPLNIACRYRPTLEMISLLINVCPDAIREKSEDGLTPLHSACSYQASFEVVSLLLQSWPAGVKEKDNIGMTPLHNSCEFEAPVEVVSLLMEKYPAASREKDRYGRTPLQSACWHNAPEGVLKRLLEECPSAVKTNDLLMGSLQEYDFENEEARKLVSSVCCIMCDEMSKEAAVEIMTYFIKVNWWGGVCIFLSVHPDVLNVLEINDKYFPYLLSRVKHPWKLLTIWQLISNKQDLLAT